MASALENHWWHKLIIHLRINNRRHEISTKTVENLLTWCDTFSVVNPVQMDFSSVTKKSVKPFMYERPLLRWLCAINRYEFDRHPPFENSTTGDRYIDSNKQTQQQKWSEKKYVNERVSVLAAHEVEPNIV